MLFRSTDCIPSFATRPIHATYFKDNEDRFTFAHFLDGISFLLLCPSVIRHPNPYSTCLPLVLHPQSARPSRPVLAVAVLPRRRRPVARGQLSAAVPRPTRRRRSPTCAPAALGRPVPVVPAAQCSVFIPMSHPDSRSTPSLSSFSLWSSSSASWRYTSLPRSPADSRAKRATTHGGIKDLG